jgi:hypothetical protein
MPRKVIASPERRACAVVNCVDYDDDIRVREG